MPVGKVFVFILTKAESMQGFFSYRMKLAELETEVVIPAVPVTIIV